jgi:hypothetical protein
MKNDNLTPINDWINNNEERIRKYFSIKGYKVWKEAKEPFHIGIQKKTQHGIYKKTGQPFYDYGPIQKIKITFQNQVYLKPYMENCDILWWVRDEQVIVIDMKLLKDTQTTEIENSIGEKDYCSFQLKDNFNNAYFTPEQVSKAIVDRISLTEKINFAFTRSFYKYKLSYFKAKKHTKAWVITFTHNETGFHANKQDWADYSKSNGNCKNIQLKRNEKKFIKAIHNEKMRIDGRNLKEWSFYTEDENFVRPGWISSYIKQESVLHLLNTLFSIQLGSNCNYVNNSSLISIDKHTIESIIYIVTDNKLSEQEIQITNNKMKFIGQKNFIELEKGA